MTNQHSKILTPLCVGVVHWYSEDEIAISISNALAQLGHEPVPLHPGERIAKNLQIVIAYGPFGSFVPITRQLLASPAQDRPRLIWWITEQFPNPNLPEWLRFSAGSLRSFLERMAYFRGSTGEWQLRPGGKWIISKAHRFRYYGDLYWLQRTGLLSGLATPSRWTAGFLRARGFHPVVAYIGSDPRLGADLNLERDLPVLWLGKAGTQRRKQLLEKVRSDLRARGIDLFMVDGEEHPFTFGEERTRLFNRTRIALNLLREPWDDNSLRYYLAALNHTMIVTEPTFPHTPFQNKIHIAEAPVEQLADTICYYLAHETERQQIAANAYQLVSQELTMTRAVEAILNGMK